MVLALSDPSCSSLIELKSSTNAGSWQRHHWLSALIQCRLVSLWQIVQLTLWTQVIRFTSDWTLTVHCVFSEHYQLMVYEMKHHWLVRPKPIPASSTCCTGTAAHSIWIADPVALFSSATKLNSNGQLKQRRYCLWIRRFVDILFTSQTNVVKLQRQLCWLLPVTSQTNVFKIQHQLCWLLPVTSQINIVKLQR